MVSIVHVRYKKLKRRTWLWILFEKYIPDSSPLTKCLWRVSFGLFDLSWCVLSWRWWSSGYKCTCVWLIIGGWLVLMIVYPITVYACTSVVVATSGIVWWLPYNSMTHDELPPLWLQAKSCTRRHCSSTESWRATAVAAIEGSHLKHQSCGHLWPPLVASCEGALTHCRYRVGFYNGELRVGSQLYRISTFLSAVIVHSPLLWKKVTLDGDLFKQVIWLLVAEW